MSDPGSASDHQPWIRDFFAAWQGVAKSDREDAAFYRALRTLNPDTLQPDDVTLFEIESRSQQELELVALWNAWRMFLAGDGRLARHKIVSIAEHWPLRPEPHVFLALIGLASNDRKSAYEGVRAALRLEPHQQALHELLGRLGVRRPPVLGFLDRHHPLNVVLGRLRQRLRRPPHPRR